MANQAGREKVVELREIGANGNFDSENDLAPEAEDATVNVPSRNQSSAVWLITLGVIAAIVMLGVIWIFAKKSHSDVSSDASGNTTGETKTTEKPVSAGSEAATAASSIIKLSPEAMQAANMQIEGVATRAAIAPLQVTGSVEMNPSQTQSVTPLISGRVERVFYKVGDNVGRGAVLATIASPQVAQMHGKMHEAETRLAIAERNLERVQRTENRVAVLQAKARLDEADATLRRMRRLVEVGASAGKDLIAADAAYKSAKADYDFQSNISLNKEIREARATVDTSRTDLGHIRDEMIALGATPEKDGSSHQGNSSLIYLRAPAAGQLTERLINDGSGVEAGKSLITISNLSNVYVIANVPETQMPLIRNGTPAEVKLPTGHAVNARVSFIEPNLNQETRTGRVRLEVPNANGVLRAGMFVEVGFLVGSRNEELVIPTEAVQNIDGRSFVFIPQENENGAFEKRAIETAGEVENYTRVRSGLKLGDKIVTKGSFALKTQLKKSEVEE